ncbi:kinase-like domain-containing protein [Suillus subluteus]|nr:kinase-like domain-containing protein [Suillus subluteus]
MSSMFTAFKLTQPTATPRCDHKEDSDQQEAGDVQPCSSLLGIIYSLSATNFGARHPSAQPIPPIIIPDLTELLTRCCQYPVSSGAYGDIYKCIYHGPDGDAEVAVKAIRPFFSTTEFIGTTRGFGSSEVLVAPWIVNGNLTLFLSENNDTLGLHDRLLLLRDTAAGLNYFHTFSVNIDGNTYFNPVVHGDLTGNNVLVGGDRTAYVSDIGLSGTLTQLPGMTYLAMLNCHAGAWRWSAPEQSVSMVTTHSDIYSFGSIMLQVLTGNLPWSHLTHDFQMYQVIIEQKKHPRPTDDHITDQHWNFMTSCWTKTAINRPSAEEALQFIDSEIVLHDLGSVDGGQHPALVPVSGYSPQPSRQLPHYVSLVVSPLRLCLFLLIMLARWLSGIVLPICSPAGMHGNL